MTSKTWTVPCLCGPLVFAYIFDKKLKNMSGYDIIQKNKGE